MPLTGLFLGVLGKQTGLGNYVHNRCSRLWGIHIRKFHCTVKPAQETSCHNRQPVHTRILPDRLTSKPTVQPSLKQASHTRRDVYIGVPFNHPFVLLVAPQSATYPYIQVPATRQHRDQTSLLNGAHSSVKSLSLNV